MMRAYSSGFEAARTIASTGPMPAATTTINRGNTIRMPNTAIRMPHVRKRWRQTGVMVFSLLAFTMALSKDREISKTDRIRPMNRKLSAPESCPE